MDKYKLNPMRIVIESNPEWYYPTEKNCNHRSPVFFVTINGKRIEDVKSFAIELNNEQLRTGENWHYKIEHEISPVDNRFVEKINDED
jgi:hypothetical protein